jgi:hypothetical protein
MLSNLAKIYIYILMDDGHLSNNSKFKIKNKNSAGAIEFWRNFWH